MTFLKKQKSMPNVTNILKKKQILLYDRFGFVKKIEKLIN